MMGIKWAPLNVPMHRRMEVIAVAVCMSIALFGGPVGALIVLYCLLAGNVFMKTLSIVYLVFLYFDWNAGDTGGRGTGWDWLRRRTLWKHYLNYFPIDLVKTVDLPADRNYLICLFPHGVLCQGAFGNFSTTHSKWGSLFPKIRAKFTTLGVHMYMPFFRDLIMGYGMCSASPNALNHLLKQSNDPNDKSNKDGFTANAAILLVGGAQEAYLAFPNTYRFVLKHRKGFARIALKSGSALIPAISFGETNVFDVTEHEPGTKWRKFQDTFKRYTNLAPVHFNGRGFFQYSFGILPRRHPITTVIGSPIPVSQVENPSRDQVSELHQLFCERLVELFETEKNKYVKDADNVHIEFI